MDKIVIRYVVLCAFALVLLSSCSGGGKGYEEADFVIGSNLPLQTYISESGDTAFYSKYKAFNEITIGTPGKVLAIAKNNDELVKSFGFAFFASRNGEFDITVRQKEILDLKGVKIMLDGMSKGLYKGDIVRSEIIKVNGIEVFVSDVEGYWNGSDTKIGMFRYYFNKGDYSYNLLMKYPYSEDEKYTLYKE